MNIKELKEAIKDLDDNMEIIMWFHPDEADYNTGASEIEVMVYAGLDDNDNIVDQFNIYPLREED